MGLIENIINNEFGLLFILTLLVWGGFMIYLTYIFYKMQSLQKDLNSLKQLESAELK